MVKNPPIPGAEKVTALAKRCAKKRGRQDTLARLVEAASEEGARRALSSIGLEDKRAVHDIRDLRDLLEAWRKTKTTAWHTFVRWMTTLFFVLILAGLAIKLKLPFFHS